MIIIQDHELINSFQSLIVYMYEPKADLFRAFLMSSMVKGCGAFSWRARSLRSSRLKDQALFPIVAIQVCNPRDTRCCETVVVYTNNGMEEKGFEGEAWKDAEPRLQE